MIMTLFALAVVAISVAEAMHVNNKINLENK
jgi:hypothetical protein